MVSAVAATSRTMKQFLDDLHSKASAAEYRQPGSQEKQPSSQGKQSIVRSNQLSELTEEEQQSLERVVAKLPHIPAPDPLK
jgi:hypothetical protein